MALLEVTGISKNFGSTHVLQNISLNLEKGEALAIIGSSGSGKTTLLRCLNFLETPDTGVIRVDGKTLWDAADPATHRESEVRKKRLHFGLVFQNFNLFPQYTALQNITLAGELLAKEKPEYKVNRKAIHAELEEKARTLLAQMGLSERENHYPHQLSGGQQQRVAIARALALEPDILCFDEPTSGNWNPATTWLSAGDNVKFTMVSVVISGSPNVDASMFPSVSHTHKSIRAIFFSPSIVLCKIWFEIILSSHSAAVAAYSFHSLPPFLLILYNIFREKKRGNVNFLHFPQKILI